MTQASTTHARTRGSTTHGPSRRLLNDAQVQEYSAIMKELTLIQRIQEASSVPSRDNQTRLRRKSRPGSHNPPSTGYGRTMTRCAPKNDS
jgi:hypothetical protein